MDLRRAAERIEGGCVLLIIVGGAMFVTGIFKIAHHSPHVADWLLGSFVCVGAGGAGMRAEWYGILWFTSKHLKKRIYQLQRAQGRQKPKRCAQVMLSIHRCIQERYDDPLETALRDLPLADEFVADDELCKVIIPPLVILLARVSEPSFYHVTAGTRIADSYADEYDAKKRATCQAMATTITSLLSEAAAHEHPRSCLTSIYRAVGRDKPAAERWALKDEPWADLLWKMGMDCLKDSRFKPQFPEKGYDVMVATLRSILKLP